LLYPTHTPIVELAAADFQMCGKLVFGHQVLFSSLHKRILVHLLDCVSAAAFWLLANSSLKWGGKLSMISIVMSTEEMKLEQPTFAEKISVNALSACSVVLEQTERLLVITGAGISAESGMPTYRGPEGHYTKNPGQSVVMSGNECGYVCQRPHGCMERSG
jgi:hypothetical protein